MLHSTCKYLILPETYEVEQNKTLLDRLDGTVVSAFYYLRHSPPQLYKRPLPGFVGMRRAFQEVCSIQVPWDEAAAGRFHILWIRVVAAYSRRHLTHEGDRLAALARRRAEGRTDDGSEVHGRPCGPGRSS